MDVKFPPSHLRLRVMFFTEFSPYVGRAPLTKMVQGQVARLMERMQAEMTAICHVGGCEERPEKTVIQVRCGDSPPTSLQTCEGHLVTMLVAWCHKYPRPQSEVRWPLGLESGTWIEIPDALRQMGEAF